MGSFTVVIDVQPENWYPLPPLSVLALNVTVSSLKSTTPGVSVVLYIVVSFSQPENIEKGNVIDVTFGSLTVVMFLQLAKALAANDP